MQPNKSDNVVPTNMQQSPNLQWWLLIYQYQVLGDISYVQYRNSHVLTTAHSCVRTSLCHFCRIPRSACQAIAGRGILLIRNDKIISYVDVVDLFRSTK